MKSFSEFLKEASLSGNSRSGQKSNWETYIASDSEWENKEYEVEKDDILYDETLKVEIGEALAGDSVKILSLELKMLGRSSYANVSIFGDEGYLNIGSIKKPRVTNNSKELTPKKLGITGKKFNIHELVNNTKKGINNLSSIPSAIREYLFDCVDSIANKNLFEEKIERFSKSISLSKSYKLSDLDLRVISKNFGEVLSALFILKTNKKGELVEFPEAENEGLYDFVRYEDSGQRIFYSVKAATGSVTALKNLNKFIEFLSDKYNKDDINKLKLLITDKDNKTIDIIIEYINKFEPELARFINDELGIEMSKLSHHELSLWWRKNAKHMTEDKISDTFTKIYDRLNYPLNANTVKTLKSIFSAPKEASNNGYILYPLGSYIARSLNNDPAMLKILNDVLNTSYISNSILQCTVNNTNSDMTIKLIKFANNTFRFDYNAMMKAPGNRPLGFKEI